MMVIDLASSRRRWAGNSLAIGNSLEKARYIGGFPSEGKDLNYMRKLLDLYHLYKMSNAAPLQLLVAR